MAVGPYYPHLFFVVFYSLLNRGPYYGVSIHLIGDVPRKASVVFSLEWKRLVFLVFFNGFLLVYPL